MPNRSSINSRHFNPQVPCGTRPIASNRIPAHTAFQSTGPLRDPTRSLAGPDGWFGKLESKSGLFQSTGPLRDPTPLSITHRRTMVFQSTGPLRDPTARLSAVRSETAISIHRSLAGPDPSGADRVNQISISIHRSLAGPDHLPQMI